MGSFCLSFMLDHGVRMRHESIEPQRVHRMGRVTSSALIVAWIGIMILAGLLAGSPVISG